jgi:hypothetical protein
VTDPVTNAGICLIILVGVTPTFELPAAKWLPMKMININFKENQRKWEIRFV